MLIKAILVLLMIAAVVAGVYGTITYGQSLQRPFDLEGIALFAFSFLWVLVSPKILYEIRGVGDRQRIEQ